MFEMIIDARRHDLGGFEVGRVLPFAKRRMVGPFIFFDHMGPHDLPRPVPRETDVRPHPHIGLSTVTYLFEGDPAESLRVKPDENSRVGWIAVSEIAEKSTEPWFVERIYSKLVKKVSDEFPPQEGNA